MTPEEQSAEIARTLLEYFTPAHVAHDQDYCAYYKCDSPRADNRRWCTFHCEVRQVCITALGGGKVLKFA
jgi:predicted RNA-binding Zn ribbon-like protein